MQTVAWNFYVSKPTVSKVIRDTCKIIWDKLSPICLPRPTADDFRRYSRDFQELWNMPNCFGAIDGKHIVVQAPYNTGTSFFNYKKTFSIVLMAVCDANYIFTLVDVGAFGSQSDGGVFKESAFGIALDNNELEIPDDSCLPETDTKFPYYMVADEAFPLKSYIMRPYPGTKLDKTQKTFNYRLSRARRVIENSFGILASRWRIFRSTIIAHVDTAEWIVCAGLCLHNFLWMSELISKSENATYCPPNYADTWDNNGNVISGQWRQCEENIIFRNMGRMGANNATRKNVTLRDTLAEYLISPEGAVSWQEAYITRGSF
ncbi:protein ANTAGONIST OF LIKE HETEROCHROMATIN PROTEIN 1-like [Temnothorax curvispinosus]|uniref:Protein ANTAGONIST OF LIKE HETEROCHROMATIN PROTEIN 1-like n=1 Tax=Temnothorax curvispinosus TaxID=300111 RepID=A0A6J1QQB9_9HYME|nr:protein ANTAGONIST OF LIKE HETEROCHROMATIN PROTEIN 1-like [Temnothorax curvispinosus]